MGRSSPEGANRNSHGKPTVKDWADFSEPSEKALPKHKAYWEQPSDRKRGSRFSPEDHAVRYTPDESPARSDPQIGPSNSSDASSFSFAASEYNHDHKHHLLLAASGSVATIKLPNIVNALSHHDDLSIRIIVTKSAEKFLAGQSEEQPMLESLMQVRNVDGIYRDEDEWDIPWTRGREILHIELRRWADIMVIAPLSANTMAKITYGFADNLLTCVLRAWDTTGLIDDMGHKKRVIVCPAMNTAMWRHPVTARQLRILEDDWGAGGRSNGWFEVLRPMEKELACGDVGDGAMRAWNEVVEVIETRLFTISF